jgi:hypothetical protein
MATVQSCCLPSGLITKTIMAGCVKSGAKIAYVCLLSVYEKLFSTLHPFTSVRSISAVSDKFNLRVHKKFYFS